MALRVKQPTESVRELAERARAEKMRLCAAAGIDVDLVGIDDTSREGKVCRHCGYLAATANARAVHERYCARRLAR